MAVDTGILGLVTVGLVSGLTRSGALVLLTAGVGVLCIALGGGTAGRVGAGGTGYAEDTGLEMMVEDMDIWPGASSDVPVRARLVFYGLGLVAWSLTVLGLFGSSLR